MEIKFLALMAIILFCQRIWNIMKKIENITLIFLMSFMIMVSFQNLLMPPSWPLLGVGIG